MDLFRSCFRISILFFILAKFLDSFFTTSGLYKFFYFDGSRLFFASLFFSLSLPSPRIFFLSSSSKASPPFSLQKHHHFLFFIEPEKKSFLLRIKEKIQILLFYNFFSCFFLLFLILLLHFLRKKQIFVVPKFQGFF